MVIKDSILTEEERAVLVLAGAHPDGQHLNNTEIAQCLDMSVSKVKILIHQACIKLGAQNRIEAMFFALTRGEIRINEIYSLDEIAEMMSALCPDIFRRIAHLLQVGPRNEQLLIDGEEISYMDRRQDAVLTKREQDVLTFVGRGLTNKEIADKLYMSTGTVRAFLHRACTKLGARSRLDAAVIALKQGEILISETLSLNELTRLLAPLGADSISKIDQLLNQRLVHEQVQYEGLYNRMSSDLFRVEPHLRLSIS